MSSDYKWCQVDPIELLLSFDYTKTIISTGGCVRVIAAVSLNLLCKV